MPGTKIHIHSSSSTYKLEVSSFEELLREISRIEHANSDSIQIKHDNKVLDEHCDFSSLENTHVDVSVSMIGPDTQFLLGTGATQDLNNLSFGNLEAKFEEFKKMYLEDKALVAQEMRDIRRQQNDTARQLSKLCLIFHGKSVNDLLQNNKRNLFKPGISLLEKFYGIKIKDYEIHDLHPISKFVRGQLIKAIIVKFNHRHDKSAYM